ncbi:HNH endonuclease domain-containing protein, partial [Trabulsiella odontotermitis]
MSFPDPMLGFRRDLLKGDMYREWGRWFIEQFIDAKYLSNNVTYAEIFYDVFLIIDKICGWTYDRNDKQEISGIISKYVLQRIRIITESYKRKKISLSEKRELLELLGDKPRCWLTGMLFSQEAIDLFLGRQNATIKLPDYVDKYMPIGLIDRDLKIEIDHLYPFALGGDDSIENFRLICGWANMVKSSQVTMYGR